MSVGADIRFAVLVDDSYTSWSKNFVSYFPSFGLAGKAPMNGFSNEPSFPEKKDRLKDRNGLDTDIYQFDNNDSIDEFGDPAVFQFVGDGLKDFKRAVKDFPAVITAYNIGNNSFATFMLLHLSPSVKKALLSVPAFKTALLREVTDTFSMWTIIKHSYCRSTGRAQVSQLRTFLQSSQGNLPHEDYVEKLQDGLVTTIANYESDIHPGYISIDALACGIYLSGLDKDFFRFIMEQTWLANPTGRVTGFPQLISDYQLYARQHRDELRPASDYASALVAKVAKAGVCLTCSGPVVMKNSFGKFVKYCSPCYRDKKSKEDVKLVRPGPIIKKASPSELLAARALVAAADLVSSPTVFTSTLDDSDSD